MNEEIGECKLLQTLCNKIDNQFVNQLFIYSFDFGSV